MFKWLKKVFNIKRKEEMPWRPTLIACSQLSNDTEKVKLVYQMAQESLQTTIDSHNFIEKKILLLLSYLFPINTFLIGYIIKKYNILFSFKCQNIYFYWQILSIILIISIIIFFLIYFLRINTFEFKGNDPKNLITEECAKETFNNIMIDETIWYQSKIEANRKATNRISFWFNLFMGIILFLPISFLIPINQNLFCRPGQTYESVLSNYLHVNY